MKKFFKSTWAGFLSVADSIGRARAAAELTRNGYHQQAKAILLKD
jgi:hypothetical protein